MIELEKYEEKIVNAGKNAVGMISTDMNRMETLTLQHQQAIEIQAKGIIASMQGILRSKGLEQ